VLPLKSFTRAYASHHQVAIENADDQSDDVFVRGKKAMHFGMRRHCVLFHGSEEAEEANGVKMIQH
jgi:hypothetical protein